MFWRELAERDSRSYYVAVLEGAETVVGYAGLCAYSARDAYVQTLGVTTTQQRRGLGDRLLRTLLDDASRRGCTNVDLEVRAGNHAAIRLYERHDFERLGLRRGYYQPSGADAVVMRRKLAP
jgi:ribosomal-protein-alanine N-acetyltransferase